jgi:phosphoribosylaminoimidazole-succinocarboxamide synthase
VSSLTHVASGKVREIYEVDDTRLLIVASDRISAYDVVLPQAIPDKGRVLTGLSHFWFGALESICPHHCISLGAAGIRNPGWDDLEDRSMLCLKAQPLPVEFVVRGYLAGSGWSEYKAGGSICGHRLPPALREAERLPEPLLTPATKAVTGHDENITEDEAGALIGRETFETAKTYALALYETASERASGRGVIIADTKFEFGLIDGEVVLIDEALTPDSSRFWPADEYRPGGTQPSFDKQFVRDWLNSAGWDRSPPAPDLPEEVVAATSGRYREAYERITGKSLSGGR